MTRKKHRYLVAVDGGATKTVLILADVKGNILGKGKGGSCNIQTDSRQAWQSIETALAQAMDEAGLGAETNVELYCTAGLAGTEIPAAVKKFIAGNTFFSGLSVKSDGYTSCLGAHGGKNGIVIAVGTGVIGFKVHNNLETRVGGWGFPHGDEGGGAWIGRIAMGWTLQWLDGRMDKSPVFEKIFEKFNNDLTQMIIWANQTDATGFATLTPLVVKLAGQGDHFARDILGRAAREIEKCIIALFGRNNEHSALPCALLGGLAGVISGRLCQKLSTNIVQPTGNSLDGALAACLVDFKNFR